MKKDQQTGMSIDEDMERLRELLSVYPPSRASQYLRTIVRAMFKRVLADVKVNAPGEEPAVFDTSRGEQENQRPKDHRANRRFRGRNGIGFNR